MTLNTQTRSTEQVNPAYRLPTQSWKWEKRHALLVIALSLLVLWYFIPQIKASPTLQKAVNSLSTWGGLLFAADSVIKLVQ